MLIRTLLLIVLLQLGSMAALLVGSSCTVPGQGIRCPFCSGLDIYHCMLVCWWWRFNWNFAVLKVSVIATTFIISWCSKIHDGDILVSAYTGYPGNWSLKLVLCMQQIKSCGDDSLQQLLYHLPKPTCIAVGCACVLCLYAFVLFVKKKG